MVARKAAISQKPLGDSIDSKSEQQQQQQQQQQPNGADCSSDIVTREPKLQLIRSLAYMDTLLPAKWSLWWLPIALTFLCYSPNLLIFANDAETWIYDDQSSVRRNPCVIGVDPMNEPVPWTCVFWADYWGTPMSSNSSHKSYRPVTTMFFIVERLLWGFSDSRLWHLGNVATKAVAVWLFSKVSRICLTCQDSAAFATLLFAVHPIHTESVSNITGQAESLSGVFMLLAFLAYSRRRGSIVMNSTAAILASLAATLSKEPGFSALPIICLHIVSVELRAVKSAAAKKDQLQSDGYLQWRDLRKIRSSTWLHLAAYILAGVGIFVGRCCIQREKPQFNSFMNPAAFHHSRLARGLTMAYYAMVHAGLLVAPVTLCPDYSNSAIPEVEGLLDQRCLLMYLAGVALLWSAFTLVRAALDKRRDVHELLTGVAWLTLPFLPVSNLFFVVGFAVAERILFAPSIGFCLLVGLGVQRLTEVVTRITIDQTRWRLVSSLHRCLRWLLILMAIRTSLRDLDWNSSRSLWYSSYKACSPNANVLANLAFSEPDSPGFQRFLFERANAVGKPFSMDHSVESLARVMESQGQHWEMLELCQRHSKFGNPKVKQCVAYGLLQLRKPVQAVPEFQQLYARLNETRWHLSQIQPADVIRGYARSLALAGKADRALKIIRLHEADVPDPVKEHLAVTAVLADTLRSRLNVSGNFEAALARLTSRSPSPDALLDLAKELCLSGRYEEALAALSAIQPPEARQSPMGNYVRRFAQDGIYSSTRLCKQREQQLLSNLTGLSPRAALAVLTTAAERVAETDHSDSEYTLYHTCRLVVQPIDALLSRVGSSAQDNPNFTSLAAMHRLFRNGQRGELFLHTQLMTERERLRSFFDDLRRSESELAAIEVADGDDDGDFAGWSMKPADKFRLGDDD